MNDQEAVLRTGFAIFSAITSFAFVFLGVSILTGEYPTQWMKALAYVTGGYGLANIYILSWAWRNKADWPMLANKFFALCFIGVLVADTISQGIKSMEQVLVLLGLACVLVINWVAVKKLCQHERD